MGHLGAEGSEAMSRKKISTTIYVTPEQNDRLKLLHSRTKVPIAVYIREGIDLVLGTYAQLLPGQLPLSASVPDEDGPSDVRIKEHPVESHVAANGGKK